jgi:hypothetical protein
MRPSYKAAIHWIALNDEPSDLNPDSIAEYISTLLVADLFGKPADKVAKDVAKVRLNNNTKNN